MSFLKYNALMGTTYFKLKIFSQIFISKKEKMVKRVYNLYVKMILE